MINDKTFKKIFRDAKNTKDFLKNVLPLEIKKHLDFSSIKIDPTNYVSNEFKEGYSDIVVKAKMKSPGSGKIPTDIYFILEHKTEGKIKVFIQILKYMCFVWEEDINANKPPRIIIPIIFYHGKEKWKVPYSFVEQFDVDEELKGFLLDFRYILFDTNPWNFRDESNRELRDNVLLFTTLVLMKAALTNDRQAIQEIFHFWHEKGFTGNKEMVQFFMGYIFHTHKIKLVQLNKMLEESKIEGGDLMQTLAQQLKREGKREGMEENAKETAKRMLEDGLPIETISKYTGLTEKKVKALMN
ncbi:MAG: Rpn family recombination-promoting nuclease/putative transposase [Candidatus Aminicenantes bacterium]